MSLRLNPFRFRIAVLLLPAVGGLLIFSWWKTSTLPSPATIARENYFAELSTRAGSSSDQIIESLQRSIKANPEDLDSLSQLGIAYLQKARETGDSSYYPKIEAIFQKVLARDPDQYTALAGMGTLSLARHRFRESLVWGEQARSLYPYRSYAYGVIADSQIELGLYEEAQETLQRMVDLRPDLSAYSRISYLRELHGDLPGAIEMMRWAVESGAPNAENTAWVRTQLGNLYFQTGDLDSAAAEYQQTLDMLPGYIYALEGLGKVRAAQGHTEEAIDLLTRASQAVPLPELIIALGELYQRTGQTDAAQKQFSLLAAIRRLYQANGVDLDLEMALFYADHKIDLENTVATARKAYQQRPSIYAADVLAWSLYQAGNFQEARHYAQLSLRLGTKDALKLFHAGMIDYRLGNLTLARDYLSQAIRINPNFSFLYREQAEQTLKSLQELDLMEQAKIHLGRAQ